jgi:peroxiredoxin
MTQLESLKDQIQKVGGLVFIVAQKRGGMFAPEKFLESNPFSFPFLLDEDRSVTKLYGVYHRIGMDAFDIARPATFVIGRDAVIRYIHVGKSQGDHTPIDDVLGELKRAAGNKP